MTRAPFQVLIYPYRLAADNSLQIALFRRVDAGFWQGISGGGEDSETPLQAARREGWEEARIPADSDYLPLDTTQSVPLCVFHNPLRWGRDCYVIPQHCFGVHLPAGGITLSEEHDAVRWLPYEDAARLLRFEGDRTALWELLTRLGRNEPPLELPPAWQAAEPLPDPLALLDELQAIARNGLHFSENPYDRERYERLLTLATRSYGELLGLPAGLLRERFLRETGYVTPKVGADAAILNPRGEILLMDRADGGGWCLPCGWLEPNEKPAEAVLRELREETGLQAVVERLVGVFARPADSRTSPHTVVAIVYLCRATGGRLTLSHEGLELRYWALDAVPRWHASHARYARAAWELWQSGGTLPPVSD